MTRSEPPAQVIENVLRMLRESARWHDEENRPYSAGVERDAIALIESLRTSSSLGGREGGVQREDALTAGARRGDEGRNNNAEIAAQLRKLMAAYPLGTMDWPLDLMAEAALALEQS